MIYLVIILVLITLSLFIYLIIDKKKTNRKIKDEYQRGQDDIFGLIMEIGWSNRVNNFKGLNENINSSDIVFVGDSLTENYNVYEYYKGMDVYNRGIGGDTTEGLLKRMDESIFALNPKLIVLLIGINDFAMIKNVTPLKIANNIQKIISLVKEKLPNCKIILESLYPVNKEDNPLIDKASVANKDNRLINEVNELLKKIEGVNYVDMNSLISDPNGSLKLEYTIEGLHVNNKCYEVITNRLKEEIKSLQGD